MDERLKLLERLKLQLNGYVKTGEKTDRGWDKPLPVYTFKCDKHGLVETTPRGYKNRLICPKCELENQTPIIPENPVIILE